MNEKSGCKIKDNIHLVLRGPDGEIKEEQTLHNTIPALGDAHVADQMSEVPGEVPMSHMAIGTGVPTATTLGTELDRNALTSWAQGVGADDNDVIYIASWAAGDGTGALTEAGIFNAAAAGTMLCSSNFSVINKGALDTLTITWTVTFGST